MASINAVTVTRTPAYSSRIAKTFQQLRLNDEITDFTIVTGKQSFSCHRVILSGSSPVLQAMIRSGMTETSEHKASLDTIPPAVMQLILDYIYTGEVVIPHEHLQKTIEAADYLQLLELKEISIGEADASFKPSNIVSWYKLADRLDIEVLKSKCAEVMSSCHDEVSRFTEFQELDFAEVKTFLSSAQNTDADPDDLLEASMEWINYQPSHRTDCMEEILQKIRLLECSIEYLENEMETHESLFMSSQAGYRLMSKALVQIAKQDGVRKKHGTKNKSKSKLIVIGGQRTLHSDLNKMWELNASLQLEELCRIPDHSIFFGVCKVPDGFVLTGGKKSTLCSMYILSQKSWKQLKAMKSERCNHGSTFMNGRIFVLGGGSTFIATSSSVHSLALDGEEEWTEEAQMPISVCYPEVASVENGIFLLDGHTLVHLDLKTRTWSHRQSMPVSRSIGARMIAVQNVLLAAGSSNKIAAQYNPSTDAWTTLSSPTLRHSFGAMAAIGKRVYLIGGQDEDGIEEYNLDTGIWSVCDVRMPIELFHLHALALDI